MKRVLPDVKALSSALLQGSTKRARKLLAEYPPQIILGFLERLEGTIDLRVTELVEVHQMPTTRAGVLRLATEFRSDRFEKFVAAAFRAALHDFRHKRTPVCG